MTTIQSKETKDETGSESEKNKGPTKNPKKSMNQEEITINEPRTRSKSKIENESDKIDKETSFIILMEDKTENSGTNELIHTDSGIEVIRNNEYQPPDKIHQMVNSLKDFNVDEIPIEGDETRISGENETVNETQSNTLSNKWHTPMM